MNSNKKHKAPISVNFQWNIVASRGKRKERTEKNTKAMITLPNMRNKQNREGSEWAPAARI